MSIIIELSYYSYYFVSIPLTHSYPLVNYRQRGEGIFFYKIAIETHGQTV
ncbi:hypothetical protein KNP414_07914 [Paenibacillus mucilaginosus KNP414]|uniref:Uncharacterized protein n=1 Tax=Paenibacillus mucilaginosus (strain KNP414) TaxID=1036673 RepID=F8FKN1_PAEMK|nr:hypothetical protein KNP414_07914 [Paenibacillus mucilaginosus KNP414]